ncbi:extracellular solute-binding protein [Lapidilactobacillus achengensis]|uniref:Extracellular solute-binding protein n=1 Tax=Lapidilactobacillus achengensis TaxID=2486000 RepID=A0ABW1UQK3_9LACO|nr:extracellular solute-binding protein [Lapidilactobacillus achengensis]
MKLKKYGLLLGLALSAILVLGACGKKNAQASQGKVKLSINYYNGAISKAAMANTKEHFSNYQLQFKQVPSNEDFDTKLKASFGSKAAPDITAINNNIEDYLPYKTKFVNLTKYGTKALGKNYVTWKWDSTFADADYQIAMPIDIGPKALMFNVANFEKAGLPTDPKAVSESIKTEEDYMKAAAQMKEKANLPMFLSAVALFEDREQKMTKGIFEGGKLTLGDGQLKEAWDFAVQAYQKGYTLGIKAGGADNANAQQKGLYSAMNKASWAIADLEENGTKPGTWLIAKAPGQPSNTGGSYLAVLKTTSHPKEAAEVVRYLTNEKNQRANFKELSLFPTHKAVYDDAFMKTTNKLFGDEQYNPYFVDAANAMKYKKSDPRSGTVQRIFEDQMQLIQDQNKNPDQAWADAIKKAKTID